VKLKTVRLVAIESSLKHFPIDLYLWNECKIRTFVIKIKYISFFLQQEMAKERQIRPGNLKLLCTSAG